MTAVTDRRTVKPADPKATIPNPGHGRKLPPDGVEVAWSPYWERMLNRKEIVVVDTAASSTTAAPVEATAPGAAGSAPADAVGAPAAASTATPSSASTGAAAKA